MTIISKLLTAAAFVTLTGTAVAATTPQNFRVVASHINVNAGNGTSSVHGESADGKVVQYGSRRGFNRGSFRSRGSFNRGSFRSRGGFNRGSFNRGSFNRGSYNRGGYYNGGYYGRGYYNGGYYGRGYGRY